MKRFALYQVPLSAALSFPAFAGKNDGQEALQLQVPQSTGQSAQIATVPSALHDIHGPIDIPGPVPYVLYGLIVLAVLLLLLGLYWWFFRRPEQAASPIPPAIIARDELMRARDLMNAGQALQYMERISEILRRYLESRFRLPITRQTTREFFRSLDRELPEHHKLTGCKTELRACLEQCDLAKFAHRPAEKEHLQQLEDSILGFVNLTDENSSITAAGGVS